MKDKTHLILTRYEGEGVFIEDSKGNEEFMTADKLCHKNFATSDGDVDVFVMPNTRNKDHFLLNIFAPRKVKILREELQS